MQLTIDEEQRLEIEQGLKLQRQAIEKNRKSNEDLGNWAGVKEAERRLRIISGGPGETQGLLEQVYRESKDQGPLFNGKDGDGVSVRGGQSIDEALEGVEEEGAKREAAKASDEAEESAQAEAEEPGAVCPRCGVTLDEDPTTCEDCGWSELEEGSEAESIRTPFDDDEDGEPTDSPFRKRLTSVDAINPTMIAILRQADIHTLQEMARAGREAVAALRGLGPAKMGVLDEALTDAGLAWADTTDREDREAAAEAEEAAAAGQPHDDEPAEPAIGHTVVPRQNQSFTLEVTDRDGDRVILKSTGVAADGRLRYSDRDAMSWDAENDRWLTSRIHILAESEKPAEMPI